MAAATTLDRIGDRMQVFAPVSSLDARSIAGPTLDISFAAGERIVHEGHPLGTFFVIRTGSAELRRAGRVLRMLGPSECFGEIDPVRVGPYRYSVIASTRMRVLTFSAFGIARLCAAVPSIRGRLESFLPVD
jgi:CRP-like cAMP-binding protein